MEEADEERTRWALGRGLTRGKQILVAGFLAFSTPVVVPPLLVVSIIGISVSVPFGLFLASHACTRKLISILLPMTATPSYVLQAQHRIEVCQEECVVNQINIEQAQTTRGIEMGENEDGEGYVNKYEPQPSQHTIICEEEEASLAVEDQTVGGGKKEDSQVSEHLKQVDGRNMIDSHEPIPGAATPDETNTYIHN